MSRRSIRCASVVTLAACASLPLLSHPAFAVAPTVTDNVLIAADRDGDGGYSLYKSVNGALSAAPGVPAENPDLDIEQVAASRDGGRFVYVQDQMTATGLLEQIIVREANGTGVATLDKHTVTEASTNPTIDVYPTLSPDGTKLVFTQINLATNSNRMIAVDLGTGAGRAVAGGTGYLNWTFASDTLLISNAPQGNIVTLPYAGGTPQDVSGTTVNDGEFTVSPDGASVAFTRFTSAAGADTETADIYTGTLTVNSDNNTASVTGATQVATGLDNRGASWTPDGTTLHWVQNDGDTVNGPGVGTVYSRPANLSTAAAALTTTPSYDDAVSVADTATDSTAPAATVALGTATLAGTSVTIPLSVANPDADLAGIQVTRTGGGTTKTFRIPAGSTSIKDTGLVLGTTFSYTATPVDHSGNAGTSSNTRQLTAIAPVISVADPSTGSSTTETFRVGLPAYGTYGVKVGVNSAAPTTWIAPDDAAHNHGAAHIYNGARGNTYRFYITVHDAYGNSSAERLAGGTTVPLDQTSAAYAGSTAPVASSSEYLGSARQLRAAGASATLVAKGLRFSIIGERGPSNGILDVYVNGVRVVGIDTRAASHQYRQVLYSRPMNPAANTTIVVKARGTAGRPTVVLDAFGISH